MIETVFTAESRASGSFGVETKSDPARDF